MTECSPPPINVFILAAGSALRFGGTVVKQMLPVGGEPIIRRTIRLIREFDPAIKIHIISWHDVLRFDDVIYIDTGTKPNQMTDSMLLSEPYWGDQNIFLTGDTVFGESTMREILSYKDGVTMFFRDSCPTKPHAERFAFRFSKEDKDTVIALLQKSSRVFTGTSYETDFGMTKICYATHNERWLWLIAPITYTDGTHGFIEYIRPVRDYLIYKLWPYIWKPDNTFSLIPIDDAITTDIDTMEEYEDFLKLGLV